MDSENNLPTEGEGQPAPAPTPSPAFVSPHSADERNMAALAHGGALLNWATGMGGLMAAAVIWLTQKEKSTWVAWHGFQALIFQTAQMVAVIVVVGGVWMGGFACSFLTLGIGTFITVPIMMAVLLLGIALMAGGLVYSLYGAYEIYRGREFRYRWIGAWAERQFSAGSGNGPDGEA